MPAQRQPSAARIGLGVSLALNVGLGAWLLVASHQRPPPGHSAAPPSRSAGLAPSRSFAPREAEPGTVPAPGATVAPAPFHWSQIESDDYRQYIANLRAVGCPEATIRDLITTELGALYMPRARALWSPKAHAYWQKPERGGPTPDQARQLTALAKEEAAVSHELLGVWISPQDRIDALFLQLHGSERQLLFLPEATREAALSALREAGVDQREEEFRSRRHYGDGSERELFDEKLKHLAQVLSPEEVEEFRLRHSPGALQLRSELEYFPCTPEEFGRLLDAREAGGGKAPENDRLNRAAATGQIRTLFGEARAAEFERLTDLHYQQARRAVDELGLPAELADQAWQISRDARRTADQLAANTTLPADQRVAGVRALQATADRQLKEVLGEKASRAVRRDLKVVLGGAEARIKP